MNSGVDEKGCGANPVVNCDQQGLVVPNFVWLEDRFSDHLDLSDPLSWRSQLKAASGQFAIHDMSVNGEHVLARDPLGVNKLFFALSGDGSFECSNYWIHLIRRGYSPDRIWSVPSGHFMVVDLAREQLSLQKYTSLGFNEQTSVTGHEVASQAKRVKNRLEEVFLRIKRDLGHREVYVSLSGGLDSTGIAVLAREIIGEFTAVTFSVDPGTSGSHYSDDLTFASRIAQDLGVRFEPVLVSPDEIVSSLDSVLLYGQDWRDFNVHCGLVNFAVGKAISGIHLKTGASQPPLLLTGDVMNELMADYTPVFYTGHEFYTLPRVSVGRLRRLLVAGLDTGDREIGIFRQFGVDTIQPYAMCAQEYTALPRGILGLPGAKQRFVRQVMGESIPQYVYERPKIRAQVGSEGCVDGTLAVLIDRGIDAEWLADRFGALYSIDPSLLKEFIQVGYYRFTSQYPQ